MKQVKAMIPNLLTAGNLLGGVLAIIFTLNDQIALAPFCILVSAVLDFFDGFVARLLKVQSELGKQLDSLADMVTFGVAPGIIVYELIQLRFAERNPDHLLPYIGLVIPVFALFRLAKFNIDTKQQDHFIGLPTPAMTLFFVSFPILISESQGVYDTSKYELVQFLFYRSEFLPVAAIIMSVLMVIPLPLLSLKFKTFGWKGNEMRFVLLLLCIGMLIILKWWALPLIIILYVILSIINNLLTKSAKDEI